jgi:hypothetical protein
MTPSIASTKTFDLPPLSPSVVAGRSLQVVESIRLAAVTERSQDITLTTKEGDSVTLSLDQSTVAVYGRDGRLSLKQQYAEDADGTQSTYRRLAGETHEWSGIESSWVSTLSIEGNLSRDEIRDIRKALQHIHHLIGRTFGSDTIPTSGLYGLASLETLEGIEVESQQSRTILAARTNNVSALTYGLDGHAAPAPDVSLTPEQGPWQTAADKVLDFVRETEIAPQQFEIPLRHLFHHWAEKLGRHHSGSKPMVQKMANTVFDQLRTMTQKP